MKTLFTTYWRPLLLVFLITAIGADFVLQEFVHFVLPQLTNGKLG